MKRKEFNYLKCMKKKALRERNERDLYILYYGNLTISSCLLSIVPTSITLSVAKIVVKLAIDTMTTAFEFNQILGFSDKNSYSRDGQFLSNMQRYSLLVLSPLIYSTIFLLLPSIELMLHLINGATT